MNTCEYCDWRNKKGFCENPNFSDDFTEKKDNMLIYTIYEGGAFWVGKDFGCIHFTDKVD